MSHSSSVMCLMISCLFLSCTKRRFNPSDVDSAQQRCPSNFVWVPADPTVGLGSIKNTQGITSFCIARFEMKHPSDLTGQDLSYREPTAIPQSVTFGRPWTLISRDDAILACARMGEPGFTFSLISNSEWQAVARNLEKNVANWSKNQVGEITMPRGNSERYHDQNAKPLDVAKEEDPWSGTSADKDFKLRRTFILSTGDVIWDFAGNVSEWVSDNRSDLGLEVQNPSYVKFHQFDNLTEKNRLIFGPDGKYGTISYGGVERNLGVLKVSGWDPIMRGGSMVDSLAGVFYTNAGLQQQGHMDTTTGFRCIARPNSSTPTN